MSKSAAFLQPSTSRRLMKEIELCHQDTAANVRIELVGADMTHMKGHFLGPPGTVYEGGHFTVDIVVPFDYPFKPPKVKFDTPIYHPNMSSVTGAICLDILKADEASQSRAYGYDDGQPRGTASWSPVYTLKTVLLSLQTLLQCPEPNDPQDAEVARIFIQDRKQFDDTATAWTRKYATETPDPDLLPPGITQQSVTKLMEMGFDRAVVVKELIKCSGNEDECIEHLLSSM